MSVRPLAQDDADAAARIHAASFPRPWSAVEIAGLLAMPGVSGWIADAPAPFAFVLVRAIAGEAEILTLAVEPERRRAGAGRALMAAAAAQAAGEGAGALFLEVAVDNAPAIGLYRGLGFETAGRRPGYYRDKDGPVDALLLSLRLNSVID